MKWFVLAKLQMTAEKEGSTKSPSPQIHFVTPAFLFLHLDHPPLFS